MTPREALRSRDGERLAHAPLRRADAGEPGTAARCPPAHARRPPVRLLPPRLAAADGADRRVAAGDERPADPLPGGARRPRRPSLRDAEVPDAQARRGAAPRAVSRRGARTAHAGRDDQRRRVAAQDAARRGPAAAQCPERGHEPRRATADPTAILRGARRRPACVLAAPRRPPWADGVRADPPRLRDVDGREARARPRVDRRPLGAPLSADTVDDRHTRPQADLPIAASNFAPFTTQQSG